MNNLSTFEIITIISFASLGFRAITGKGMIFYFMREWLDKKAEFKKKVQDDIESLKESLKCSRIMKEGRAVERTTEETNVLINNLMIFEDHSFKKQDFLLYCMKPIILCSTCMASIHTLIWYPILTHKFDVFMIAVMLSVAFLNTILWSIIEQIQNK